MSVSFYPSPLPQPRSWSVRFWCDAPEQATATREQATAAAAGHAGACAECTAYDGPLVDGVAHWPEFNLANGNAELLLRALGQVEAATAATIGQYAALAALGQVNPGEPDPATVPVWAGEEDAESFLGRVLLALGIAPVDAGTPDLVEGNVISCGRPAGYLQGRLEQARELAQYCREHQLQVSWA